MEHPCPVFMAKVMMVRVVAVIFVLPTPKAPAFP